MLKQKRAHWAHRADYGLQRSSSFLKSVESSKTFRLLKTNARKASTMLHWAVGKQEGGRGWLGLFEDSSRKYSGHCLNCFLSLDLFSSALLLTNSGASPALTFKECSLEDLIALCGHAVPVLNSRFGSGWTSLKLVIILDTHFMEEYNYFLPKFCLNGSQLCFLGLLSTVLLQKLCSCASHCPFQGQPSLQTNL